MMGKIYVADKATLDSVNATTININSNVSAVKSTVNTVNTNINSVNTNVNNIKSDTSSILTKVNSLGSGSSGAIKSVQRGEAIGDGDGYANVTISRVDLTKAFVIITGGVIKDSTKLPHGYFTSSTSLRLYGTTNNYHSYWQVIEFY